MNGYWLYGAVLVLSILQVLAFLYARHKRVTDDPVRTSGPGVECTDCGAVNEQGYEFCRRCVSPLPGEDGPLASEFAARGRRTV